MESIQGRKAISPAFGRFMKGKIMHYRLGRRFWQTLCILSLLLSYPLSNGRAQGRIQTDMLLADIDRYAKMDNDSVSLAESIRDRIEENPGPIAKALLPKMKQTELGERRLAIYVWALGLTKDPMAVDDIIGLIKSNKSGTKSDLVQISCFKALAAIGGQNPGEFLSASLDSTIEETSRFGILNLLGQMQYDPALPKTMELLKKDPRTFSWQNMLVFGKMGDKAVPFLLGKIGDRDLNVRGNAIYILGQWLIAPEATRPLQEQFWKESDLDIRGLILSSLEWLTGDLKMIREFSEEVISRGKKKELVDFANETLKNLKKMEESVTSFKNSKKESEKVFREEYEDLYKSAGKTGDYRNLSVTSKPEDEPKLKKLRERILQRDSDEAFADYKKVNEIIIFNRLMKNTKG